MRELLCWNLWVQSAHSPSIPHSLNLLFFYSIHWFFYSPTHCHVYLLSESHIDAERSPDVNAQLLILTSPWSLQLFVVSSLRGDMLIRPAILSNRMDLWLLQVTASKQSRWWPSYQRRYGTSNSLIRVVWCRQPNSIFIVFSLKLRYTCSLLNLTTLIHSPALLQLMAVWPDSFFTSHT